MILGPEQFAQALHRLLQAQLDCAGRLLDLLARERRALACGEAVELDAVTAEKPTVLNELERLDREQRGLLNSLEFEASADGLGLALGWCDRNGELAALQQQVNEQVLLCRERNGQNGLMVQHRIGFVRRALGALHGSGSSATLTYGSDGRQQATLPSRLLASG